MSHKILTIDIRDEFMTAVLLDAGMRGNRILSWTRVRMEPEQESPEGGSSLSRAISKIAGEMDLSGSTCLLSIPPSEMTYRNVTVPFKERKKIEQILPFELESSLASAIDELTIDFSIVRKSDYTDVMAVAVKSQRVNETIETFKSFGITPVYITTAPVAEALCLAGTGSFKGESFLFVSVDDTCATVCMVCSGILHLARTLMLPTSDGERRASRLKKEILRMLAAFESIYAFDFQFEHILFSCIGENGAEIPVHVSELKKTFEMDVQLVDMLDDPNLKILSQPGKSAFENRMFNSALALAAIETGRIAPFNFCRGRNLLQKYWNENKGECIATGALLVCIFLLIMANALVQIHSLQGQVRQVDREITGVFTSTLPGHTRIVDPLQQLRVELNQARQRSQLTRNPAVNIANIEILNEISRAIPEGIDVLIGNMSRSESSVTISGTIDTFNAVDEIKGRLEQIAIFERITISSANMDNSINRIRFRIRVDLAGT